MSQRRWGVPSAARSRSVNLLRTAWPQRRLCRGDSCACGGLPRGKSADGCDGATGVHNILVRHMRTCAVWLVCGQAAAAFGCGKQGARALALLSCASAFGAVAGKFLLH